MGCGLLCASLLPVACAVRGVVMRESLVPPFKHSNAYGSRVASAHWDQGDARVLESFIRLTGGDDRAGRLWSLEPLGADALSLELSLRLAGEGPAGVDSADAAGLALWFAPGGEAPTLASAFAAPPFVYEDTTEAPEALRAVGVAFGPSGARVVTASSSGRVATVGTCAAALRFDSSSNGYDAVRSAPASALCFARKVRRRASR